MTELTKKREEVLREFLNAAVVPLIEDVLVKKLGQAMSYAKEQYKEPKREWVSLTDEEIFEIEQDSKEFDYLISHLFARSIEAKLKERNNV